MTYIETRCERILVQLLLGASIFSQGFERRNAVLWVFFDNSQPVLPHIFVTRLSLHGEIIVIGLSRCRTPVQTGDTK